MGTRQSFALLGLIALITGWVIRFVEKKYDADYSVSMFFYGVSVGFNSAALLVDIL